MDIDYLITNESKRWVGRYMVKRCN